MTKIVPCLLKTSGEKLIEKVAEEGFELRGKIWDIVNSQVRGEELVLLNLFEHGRQIFRISPVLVVGKNGLVQRKNEKKIKTDAKIGRP